MFTVTPELKAKMSARLDALPVDAHALIMASGIAYDEHALPQGVLSTLRYAADRGFTLTVSSTLRGRAINQVCAHALAHLLLHADKFTDNACHVDAVPGTAKPFANTDPLTAEDDLRANALGIEILIPTIALREAFLYFQGATKGIAERFGVPQTLAHQAMVQAKFLDPMAKIA